MRRENLSAFIVLMLCKFEIHRIQGKSSDLKDGAYDELACAGSGGQRGPAFAGFLGRIWPPLRLSPATRRHGRRFFKPVFRGHYRRRQLIENELPHQLGYAVSPVGVARQINDPLSRT
ncbi:hypothetical protein PGT21_011538 [Puccinia graminis f. sp. tritici]|uniref:Uncharacterized protein n=1 Tax=Puccinia graminis f. sp. tritici TaxID=56615 RepID=A0A5B0LUN8_PUCGR|nr:hypothetical protein PGT21_011538 [Puccinia graminis f. sp. tritici]KAA1068142.1 hypothetical protein PGTUg99_021121 [Puccinia graminis f. sp. tritici]